MAEESIINQVKSEKIESEADDEKVNPLERLVITKVGPKILPRYLGGPRGSCHDFCKYGIKHALEAKPWSKAQKRVTTRERKTKVAEETVTSLAKSRSSSKPSLTSKDEKPSFPDDIKEVTLSLTNERAVTSEKNSPPFEEINVSMEHNNSDRPQAPLEPSSLPVQECSNTQTKREIVKSKSPSGSSSRMKTESRSKQAMKSLIEGKNKSMPPSTPLSSKQNVKKSSSLSAKTAKNLTGVSDLKNHKNIEEVRPELGCNDNFPDKVLDTIEPTSANLSVEPTLTCDTTKSSSASPTSSEGKNLKQTTKQIGKSGLSVCSKKGPRHAGRGIRPVAPSHLSSGNKGKRHMHHKMHSASPSPSPPPSTSSTNSFLEKKSGGSFTSGVSGTSKINKTGHGYQGENVKEGNKIRPKRNTIAGAANKVIPARKLTFRRGKVIELQPQSKINIPRRLKFKPARLLGDDLQKDTCYTRKRNNRMKDVDDGELNGANVKSGKVLSAPQLVEGSMRRSIVRKVGGGSKIDGSKSGSEQVVLRHQNVEGKKENPRLYNNVIEETASMLAELRKSKVKALVGAFETVISLDSPREAAPSEISTAC